MDESEVPIKIQAKFYGKYRQAKDVTWKAKGTDEIVALFYTANREISVVYDKFGKILQIENVSQKAVLSEDINFHLGERFPDAKLLEFKKVTRFYVEGTTGPQHYYELLMKEGKKKTTVFFDGEMKLMKADNIFNLAVN